ncbi:MAG: BON domain-containing protein [Chloroflexi bacterium]|nr:BON domain-containing protein [Chloroflexota bacterium]
MRTDAEIQQAVLSELHWDARVEETDVGVEVDEGVVTLSGTVSSYAKRLAAQEAAHRVAGVLDVANDLRVKVPGGARRTDTEIAQEVRRALESHVLVPELAIQSTVSDGWVTLEGEVEHWHQREEAESAVRNLPGMRGVTSKIRVVPVEVGALEVRGAIEDALERRAERAASHIAVLVNDGEATLSGPVRSWTEKQAIIGAAKFTRGVRAVHDRLWIDPAS